MNIDPTATVGQAMATEAVVSTFVDNTHGLNYPNGLAFDSSGNLYVANAGANTISKITPSGLVSTFASGALFNGPAPLAFDGNGNLFVGNVYSNTIDEIAPNGAVSVFLDDTHKLQRPSGLAFDSSGNLYVSNNQGFTTGGLLGNTISKITPAGVVSTFVDTTQGLTGPAGLAFDGTGNLYVGTIVGQSIIKVTPAGAASTFLSSNTEITPQGLAFDRTNELYATGSSSNVPIVKINPVGVLRGVTLFSQTTNGLYTENSAIGAAGMAFDSNGNLYFSGSNTNTIFKVVSMPIPATTNQITIRTSVPSLPISLGGTQSVSGFSVTSAELATLITASAGSITIGDDSQTGNIKITTATLATTAGTNTVIQQSITGAGQIILDDGGSGTALNGNGGVMSLTAGTGGIIALSASNNVAEIATTGYFVNLDTSGPIGTATNRIQFGDSVNYDEILSIGTIIKPRGVYLDGLGSMYVGMLLGSPGAPIDITARADLQFGDGATVSSGSTIPTTLSLGADLTPSGAGDDGVGSLSIGPGAIVYAARMTLRGAAMKIDPTAIIGDIQYAPVANFSAPNGVARIAVDSKDDLFTASEYGASSGQSSTSVNEYFPGSTSPNFTIDGLADPVALAVDSQDNLYVAEHNANAVSEFAPGSRTPTRTINVTNPNLLAFDNSGDLFVVTEGYTSVNGNPLPGFVSEFLPGATTPTRTFGSFQNPLEMVVDGSGNVYVLDSNARVYRFLPGNNDAVTLRTSVSTQMPTQIAVDSKGDLFVGIGFGSNSVSEYAPGTISPTATITGLGDPSGLAVDARGNLFVGTYGEVMQEVLPGSTTPLPFAFNGNFGEFPVFDRSGNLFITNRSVPSEFTFNQPRASAITIRPSLSSLPITIGGTNNASGTGINLTSAELARILTASNGSITFGDTNQTGNITFVNATSATTPGASTIAVQSPAGTGQIILDDGAGSGAALNGNAGAINLASGAGGIQAKSAPNNVPEIANASTVTLVSGAGIGISEPLELASSTSLTTDTSSTGGNQFLNSLGAVTANLNAGSGSVTLAHGGTFQVAGGNFSAATLINNGSITGNLVVGSGQTLTGTGMDGPVTVQSGGSLYSSAAVGNLASRRVESAGRLDVQCHFRRPHQLQPGFGYFGRHRQLGGSEAGYQRQHHAGQWRKLLHHQPRWFAARKRYVQRLAGRGRYPQLSRLLVERHDHLRRRRWQ